VKVVFTDSIIPGKAFSSYEYNETFLDNENYVNIKKIVQRNTATWLDEVANSHSELSEYLANKTRWWWVSPASRLDMRPWGQEKFFKPLFFSLAILEWFLDQPDETSLTLVGCPVDVAEYLLELEPELIVKYSDAPLKRSITKAFIRSLFILLKDIMNIMRFHIFNKSYQTDEIGQNILTYELVHGLSIKNSYKYYFTSILDCVDKKKITHLVIGAIQKKERLLIENNNNKKIIAYDLCSIADLIKGIFHQLFLQCYFIKLIISSRTCIVNNRVTTKFWSRFLFSMFEENILKPIIVYNVISKLLSNDSVKQIIFPYEEKGIERAMLFAASEKNVKSIVFTPHPQHSLAVSMRDIKGSSCPKPNTYALCGSAYISFFKNWGGKENCDMQVWGSEKGKLSHLPFSKTTKQKKLRILLVLSHPNELKVFHKWLQSQYELYDLADFYIRCYKAVGIEHFDKLLLVVKKDFPDVKKVSGNLNNNLKDCDVVAFCATSAGIEAINLGRAGFYLELNDFFEINPCFNNLSKMQPSYSANEFLSRIKEWLEKDDIAKEKALLDQRSVTTGIFSKINREKISNALL